MKHRKIPEMKPLFKERIKKLLGDDFSKYEKILKIPPVRSIRCNTLKISPEKLKQKLNEKGWKISQPWKDYPEIMIVEGKLPAISLEAIGNRPTAEKGKLIKETARCLLSPGELGRALEHLLGYYYIQELASMLPPIALNPKPHEMVLDMCSSPGSKTTQIAAMMKNTGTIIANEVSLGRIKILAANTERCGVTNTIITKKDGVALCKKLAQQNSIPLFDKILIDAPCSGEGTLRSTYKTYLMWNPKTISFLSKLQKQMIKSAWDILRINGEIVYSTCTHAPEENEEVVDFFLKEFNNKVEIEKISLPIKPRQGITKWEDKEYLEDVKFSCRVYPQDNNTEGFFLAKFKKVKE
jgi:NOL1/NOP2/sun family putative RNA methylase